MTADDVMAVALTLRNVRPDDVGGTIGEKRVWAATCFALLNLAREKRPMTTDTRAFLVACGMEEESDATEPV